MGAALATGRLFDRRDAEHAFQSLGYHLDTHVKCDDEDGDDCIVDVEEVSGSKENARVALALERTVGEMIEEAQQCFRYRASKTGMHRGNSSVAVHVTPTSIASTPNTRQAIPSRSVAATAVVTPERLPFDGDYANTVAHTTLAFDRNGSPAHLRRLLIEDALQLRGGDEVKLVMKAADLSPGLKGKVGLNDPSIANEVGFFRGCCKYVQIPCIVKSNPKGGQYCQELGEGDRNELIDFISKGEGLTLQPCFHSNTREVISVSFQVKFHDMIVLPDADCATYELWDGQGGISRRYRDYNNLLGYKAKPGHIISSDPSNQLRVKFRSFADAAQMYPIVNQMRKEVYGDPMATMELAFSAMNKISKLHRSQATRQKQSAAKRKGAEKMAKKKETTDMLREELASTAVEWAKKSDARVLEKISLYFEKPYDRSDLTILNIEEEADSIENELPNLWRASAVVASDRTLREVGRRDKKVNDRLLWCISTLRSRNPKLLVDYATLLRFGLMAIGKGKGLLRKLTMGLIASDTTVGDFMKDNFDKFYQLQKDGLQRNEGPERLVFDNFQAVKSMRWMEGGISSRVIHATISAMISSASPSVAAW